MPGGKKQDKKIHPSKRRTPRRSPVEGIFLQSFRRLLKMGREANRITPGSTLTLRVYRFQRSPNRVFPFDQTRCPRGCRAVRRVDRRDHPDRPACGIRAGRRPSATDGPPAEFGRYRIVRRLGTGGMGSVYLAHDKQLDRDVALKIPRFGGSDSDVQVQRFYREARAMATLRHPNLCVVHDVGQQDGIHFLTMDYVEGKDLADWLRTPRRPTRSMSSRSFGRWPWRWPKHTRRASCIAI